MNKGLFNFFAIYNLLLNRFSNFCGTISHFGLQKDRHSHIFLVVFQKSETFKKKKKKVSERWFVYIVR